MNKTDGVRTITYPNKDTYSYLLNHRFKEYNSLNNVKQNKVYYTHIPLPNSAVIYSSVRARG